MPGRDHLKALMWRESILQGRNRNAQVYRYVQMVVLAFMLSTLFLRGEVTNTRSVRVRAQGSCSTSTVRKFKKLKIFTIAW